MLINKECLSILTMDGRKDNWIGDTHWCVDEDSDLGQKILSCAPWFDPVVEGGELVDVIPKDPPPKPLTEIQQLQLALAELAELLTGGGI